jgi:hypothetical protein
LQRNPGYKAVIAVKKCLGGEGLELPENMLLNLAAVFKYCPVTSMDVKMSFSIYRLLSEKY